LGELILFHKLTVAICSNSQRWPRLAVLEISSMIAIGESA